MSAQTETTTRCECPRCRAHDAGEAGPYTPADFRRLFGVVNEPEPVELPPHLIELGVEVDAAADGYDAATRSLAEALRAQAKAKTDPRVTHLRTADDDAVTDARRTLEEVEAILAAARAAYHAARQAETLRVARESYDADQAAAAAKGEAERTVRRSRLLGGGKRSKR